MSLNPGEILQLTLAASQSNSPSVVLVLRLRLVEVPVTPVPEAAYALLRSQEVGGQRQVECVRFAWSPKPQRIELICADDLRREVVRRRAVFQWQDVIRVGRLKGYQFQKIAQNGSTHFPCNL